MDSPLPIFRPFNVGIIGCGNIFGAYAKGSSFFRSLNLKSCADLNPEAARARAEEFGIAATGLPELLADPEIAIVINLTVPKVHAAVSEEILRAGKHVYSEKPLGLTVEEGRALLDLAAEKGLRIGCAPDTFLGAGLQTCRKIIDDGLIGRPLSGTAFMLASGPESWHPNPGFFYRRGAGPMMDIGPYYITALVHLLGPVKSVLASTMRARDERMATCKEQFGEMLPVEVPTHNSGNLLFENGALVTTVISFDVAAHKHSPIEIYGSQGTLVVPDPNTFEGPVELFRTGFKPKTWADMPLVFGYSENSRSIGVADMAHAIQSGRPHRCSGDLALHALEVMSAFECSNETRSWVDIKNTCTQPAPFPLGLPPHVLDA
jgi:predicted dehydrogenase